MFCNHTQWWDGKVHGRFKKDGIHTHTHTVRTDLSCFMAETQENALVIASTLFQQHRRRLYTRTSSDSQYRKQIDYSLCSQRWRRSTQSAKTRLGTDCGSDHKLLIAKFRLKLKKVGKTSRPFMHDRNQIPYDYTVEMTNRFKGLDLIDKVPEELWTEVCDTVQEARGQDHPQEKEMQKG